MKTIYKLVRVSLLVVTVLPLVFLITYNDNFEDFLNDLWSDL